MDKVSSVQEILKTLESGNSDTILAIVRSGQFSPAQPLGTDNLTLLHYLCQYGKLVALKKIVFMHPECIIQTVLCQYSLLHCACKHGQVCMVEYLIDNGLYDETMLTMDGASSPLHLAVKADHLGTVNYLLDHSPCNPMLVDEGGDYLIHTACQNGHFNMVKCLAKTGKYDRNIVNCHTRQTPLHVAARQGHLNIVQYLVEETKSDPAYVDNVGRTPLYLAVWNGRVKTVQYLALIFKGEQLTITTREEKLDDGSSVAAGKTPLHAACLRGHYNIVCYLVEECHYSITFSDGKGNLPLHSASAGGNLNIVKYLIEKCQCDPMCLQHDEWAPLHFAASKGRLPLAKYLIEEHGCDPICHSKTGHAPLHLAAVNGHFDTLKYLIEECKCDPMCLQCDEQFQWAPLHFAASEGHLPIAKYLIEEHGCDTMCLSKTGRAPIHLAAENGHFDTVKYLIDECQCDSMSTVSDEQFECVPLHFACMKGHLTIAKYLIEEHGCDPMCFSKEGHAPPHFAARNGHFDIVKYLIEECQCDPMSRTCDDHFQLAILHFAAMKGHLTMVKYLIDEQYCNAMCYTNDGNTPLHFAAENGHFDVLKYLIEECQCDAMSKTCDEFQFVPLHIAAGKGHLLITKYLIEEQHCNTMCYTKDGVTPLHFASGSDHFDVVKYLIEECQCDPMSLQCYGEFQWVPLHIAAMKGHLSIIKYLIEEHGCDPMCLSKNGYAPLHLASQDGHMDIVTYLIEQCRCDPMSRLCDEQFEWTPLHFAASNGYLLIAKYLIEKHGCDPMYRTKTGFTSVFLASENSHFDIVKYFIEECYCDPMSRIYDEQFDSLPHCEPKDFLREMVAKRLTDTAPPNVEQFSALVMALKSETVDQRVLSAEGGMAYLKEKNELGDIGAVYSGDTKSLYEDTHFVDVVAETSFEVTNESLDFQWQGYGLTLHFPQDSLPPDCKCCIVEIKATLSGSIELPEGCELVSGMYWIYCPIYFSKPVTMKLQYDGTGTEGLSFVRAELTRKQLPDRFQRIESGLFPRDSPYGIISVSQFSGWGIISRLRSRPRRYTAEVHYCSASRNSWTVLFVITCKRNLDLDHTAFRKALEEYTLAGREISDHGPHFPVVFSERSIRLDVPSSACSDGWELKDGWNLKCLSCPEISKSDVDSCKRPHRDHIPHIKLIISCDARTVTTVSSLVQKLSLIGEKDSSYFLLTCEPTCPHVHPTTPESSLLEECLSRAGIPVDCAELDQAITRSEHIADIAKQFTEWKDLFPYFGLERHKLDEIEESGHLSEQRRKMLLMWIQKYGPRATYRNLCTLLLKQHRTDVVEGVCTAVKDII